MCFQGEWCPGQELHRQRRVFTVCERRHECRNRRRRYRRLNRPMTTAMLAKLKCISNSPAVVKGCGGKARSRIYGLRRGLVVRRHDERRKANERVHLRICGDHHAVDGVRRKRTVFRLDIDRSIVHRQSLFEQFSRSFRGYRIAAKPEGEFQA